MNHGTHITEEGTLVINVHDSPAPYCEIVATHGVIEIHKFFSATGPEVLDLPLAERLANCGEPVLTFSIRGSKLLVKNLPIIIATACRQASRVDRSMLR